MKIYRLFIPIMVLFLGLGIVTGQTTGTRASQGDPGDGGSTDPSGHPQPDARLSPPPPGALGQVRVGLLVYAGGQRGVCFSAGFLTSVARHTRIQVQPHFEAATLADEEIFEYPFLVMSGQGRFELSPQEKAQFKAYLHRGGFLLASAGCSNEPWAASFESLIAELWPGQPVRSLDNTHPIFHSLFDIDRVVAKKATDRAGVYGLELGGRLVMVYCPVGLNDTANAGMGCCCCGGNEIRNARQINANILAYVLTH